MTRPINPIGNFRKAPYDEALLCPRCQKEFLPPNYPGALSRTDNQTEICSACGTQEGLEDWFGRHQEQTAWPV